MDALTPPVNAPARPRRLAYSYYLPAIGLSLGLYFLALLLPALQMHPTPDSIWPGWTLLLMGWLGFFIMQFGWLANLPYFLALLLLALRWPLAAFISATLASLLSLQLFLAFFQTIPYNESSMSGEPLHAILIGGWLWLLALALLPAAALLLWLLERRARQADQ